MTTAEIAAANLDAMPADMARALDSAWKSIRKSQPKVPAVTVQLTAGRPTSCASMSRGPGMVLVSEKMAAESSPRELLGWLLHQAAHGMLANGPVSSEGRYHSRAYRDTARGLGLVVGSKVSSFAWSAETTAISDEIAQEYSSVIGQLASAKGSFEPGGKVRDSRNRLRLTCQCDPPRISYASQATLDKGMILCEVCGQPFAPSEPS